MNLIVLGIMNILLGVLGIAVSSIGIQCYNDESHQTADIDEEIKDSNFMFLNFYVFGSVAQVLFGFFLMYLEISTPRRYSSIRR